MSSTSTSETGLVSSPALGLSDGLVTNLSFLTGFGGAVESVGLIQFAGLAAMLAGGVFDVVGPRSVYWSASDGVARAESRSEENAATPCTCSRPTEFLVEIEKQFRRWGDVDDEPVINVW